MKLLRTIALLGILSTVMQQCSQTTLTATTSGSETTNGRVCGTITIGSGVGSPNALVTLLPSSYDPLYNSDTIVARIDTTDAAGNYSFDHVATGTYTVQAVHRNDGTRALIDEIPISNDTVLLPVSTLSIPGQIAVPAPENADHSYGYVFIAGTSIFKRFDGSDNLVLDSVPASVISSVTYAASNNFQPMVIRYRIPVQSGDTAIIDNPSWKYAQRLYLNTTSTGADIPGNVTNFPVLVRLTNSTFYFDEAQLDGHDLLFTTSDNAPLPYEIERWDAAKRKAELWIKLDTVFGNDSSRYITMYWGNPVAVAASNPAAVFDSASGFEGVWHLSETSGTLASDASYHGYSGSYNGGLPRNENSPLGIGQNITQPDSDYIDIGNQLNPSLKNISIGIWIKRASFGTPQALIAKTNGDLPMVGYGFLLSIDPGNTPHFNMASGGAQWGADGTIDLMSTTPITDSTTWHYVFAVIDRSDNNLCKMYLDGADRTDSMTGTIKNVTAVATASNLRIGTEDDNNASFKGAVSEATIAFTTRSAHWVKLSYMNQKIPDALVVFGKE